MIRSYIKGLGTYVPPRVVKNADKQNLRRSPSIDTGLVEKNVIIKKLGKRQAGDLTAAHIVTEKKTRYPSHNKGGARNTRRSAGYLEFGTVKMPAEPHLRPEPLEPKSWNEPNPEPGRRSPGESGGAPS